MNRPPVWQMIKEAIQTLNGKATYTQIRDFIKQKYGDVNEKTITAQTICCSVNHPSRIHFPENKKPRKCDTQYDFLFTPTRGRVELYDLNTHGMWEIRLNEYGKLVVAQYNLAEVDSEAIDSETPDELSFPFESHLRDFLATNLKEIKPNSQNLHLYSDESGREGIEYPTDVGPIDILAQDAIGNFVIFELKLNKGSDKAVGQVLRYMGWVQKHLAAGKTVTGVLVANTIEDKLKYAVNMVPNIVVFEYQVRFDLKKVVLS